MSKKPFTIMVVPRWFIHNPVSIRKLAYVSEQYNRSSKYLFSTFCHPNDLNVTLQTFFMLEGIALSSGLPVPSNDQHHVKDSERLLEALINDVGDNKSSLLGRKLLCRLKMKGDYEFQPDTIPKRPTRIHHGNVDYDQRLHMAGGDVTGEMAPTETTVQSWCGMVNKEEFRARCEERLKEYPKCEVVSSDNNPYSFTVNVEW